MPRLSAEEKFKLWRNRVEVNKKCIDTQAEDWEKYRNAYLGDILDPDHSDFQNHFYSVNYQYADVRSSVPKLYSQSPFSYIDPETPGSDLFAEVMERVVNEVKDSKWFLADRMDALIKATKLDGRAYLKTSYKFDQDKIGRPFYGEEPNDEIIITFVPRKNLIIPRDALSVDAAPWVAHKINDQIGNIREKFKLKKEDRPSTIDCKGLPDGYSDEEKEDFQYGTYYEIEDRVARTLSIIVEGVDRFVVSPYKFPYGYYSMYDALEWNHIPGELDTKADLHFWWKQLVALAEGMTQQYNHVRKLNAKYKWMGPEPPSMEQQAQLESYADASTVVLKAGQDFQPVQHAQIGQEAYLFQNSVRQDLIMASGFNEMKQGLPQVQKTAREAMAIVAEAQDVLTYRAKQVENVVASVITKCLWHIQNSYDTTRVVALTGMEEAEYIGLKDRVMGLKSPTLKIQGSANRPFISFVGKSMTGKFKVRVKAGSAMPVDENQRRNDMQLFVTLLLKSPALAAAVDNQELAKEITKLLHLENKGIVIDPKSPEQENELLKRDVPVMPKMNEDHAAHLAAHDRANNNSAAFINHILTHKLMLGFLTKAQVGSGAPLSGGPGPGMGQLRADNIGGVLRGSSVPPGALPTPPNAGPGVSPAPQNQPPPGGIPPGVQ